MEYLVESIDSFNDRTQAIFDANEDLYDTLNQERYNAFYTALKGISEYWQLRDEPRAFTYNELLDYIFDYYACAKDGYDLTCNIPPVVDHWDLLNVYFVEYDGAWKGETLIKPLTKEQYDNLKEWEE